MAEQQSVTERCRLLAAACVRTCVTALDGLHERGLAALKGFALDADESRFKECQVVLQKYEEELESVTAAFEAFEAYLSSLNWEHLSALLGLDGAKESAVDLFDNVRVLCDAYERDATGKIVMLRSLSFTTAPATLTAYEAAWQARAAVRCNPQLSCAREQLKLVFKELV